MAEKIQVAADARRDKENFLIIARTDARAGEGLTLRSGAWRPMTVPAPTSCSWKRRTRGRDAHRLPALQEAAGGQHGRWGKTPILPAAQLKDIGFAFAIYLAMTSLVAARPCSRRCSG